MNLAVGVCEKNQFQIGQFSQFAETGVLPPKIQKMIEGHTQQELFMDYKNLDEDGNPRKRGQLPGAKGLTKQQRETAAIKAEEVRLNELEETLNERIDWLLEIADAKNLGAMADKLLKKFIEAADTASGFSKRTLASRTGNGGGL
jgi:hypothetical protein